MIRIRFHGRGGHGTKTASRIVGTAAFLAGYQAQDSPFYGAERRGAAVVAFTRIDSQPILERGHIEQPDYLVLADETLLDAAEANVLSNQAFASAIFINTTDPQPLIDRFTILPTVVAYDLTSLTLTTLGSASALSSGLAAAAAAMSGIVSEQQLVAAIEDELTQQRLDPQEIENNIAVATKVFQQIESVPLRGGGQLPETRIAKLSYDPPVISTPSVLHAGNAVARPTGSWRVERPVIDSDLCTRCGLCFVRCPDGAIALDEDGFPVIDYDHCKGCMICQQICPVRAVESKKETRAW